MLQKLIFFLNMKFVQYLFLVLAIYLLGVLIISLINRQVKSLRKRHTARKATLYTTMLTILAFSAIFWLEGVKAVAVVISIIGAGGNSLFCWLDSDKC
jgi:hypothetical protein